MSAADARTAALRAELASDLRAVERHLAAARSVDPGDGGPQAALVALSLHHAYQAFESLLVRVHAALGLGAPEGATWHSRLLEQAGGEIDGLRPALYPEAAGHHWRALLRFRHFLRHAYTANLDPMELRRNVEHLGQAVDLSAPYLEAAVGALSVAGG